jgi:uncharacterized phiE125 gp8 family phage protein
MAGLVVVTPAAVLPWTLDEVKTYLRVEHDDEDALIEGLLRTATQRVEDIAHRCLISQTLNALYDGWPSGRCLALPRPCQSVTSVKYTPDGGSEQTFSSDRYVVNAASVPGEVWLRSGYSWPSDTLEPVNGVAVRFVAGYGAAASAIPATLRQWVLMYVAHWYEHPETAGGEAMGIVRSLDTLVMAERWA